MGLFNKARMNSEEFMFLTNRLESFENSAREMSASLEKLLKALSESVTRHDEQIKAEIERSELISQSLLDISKETSASKLFMASLTGGLAVLAFIATESGLVKIVLKLQEGQVITPPPIERVVK